MYGITTVKQALEALLARAAFYHKLRCPLEALMAGVDPSAVIPTFDFLGDAKPGTAASLGKMVELYDANVPVTLVETLTTRLKKGLSSVFFRLVHSWEGIDSPIVPFSNPVLYCHDLGRMACLFEFIFCLLDRRMSTLFPALRFLLACCLISSNRSLCIRRVSRCCFELQLG